MNNQIGGLSAIAQALGLEERMSLEDLKLKNRSKYLSSIVYARVILQFGGDDRDKELICNEYKKQLVTLPSDDLQIILDAHEKDLFQRAPDTIGAIVDEIAERELMRSK